MPMEAADSSVPGIQKGVAWYYVDATTKSALTPSQKTLDDKDQAIAYTLNQYYSKKTDPTIFHAMYNDEPYNSTTSSLLDALTANRAELPTIQFGHTKGVVFFDSTSGVWLIHSVPKFPPPDHYEYPPSGHDYGQTMLCLSFNYQQLGKIATQLYYNKPIIYSSGLPTKMAADYPVIAGKYKQGEPYSSTLTFNTINGQTFTSFAKTNQFNNDLYDALVAPTLKSDLIAETWRRGSEIPLSCGASYHTNDALEIQVGSTSEFKYTKDHSKMARSTDPTKPWVCIGDINRMFGGHCDFEEMSRQPDCQDANVGARANGSQPLKHRDQN
ncbi:deoxyribonuclease-2 [Ancylostoma duodenale]|uniref:Deoxyribonuclease-2 n=1 Tax=Ancylostoma duodenale TaxID=51022 RepID=A0A0C2GRY4_9BILA|nr:deoxyribonuclease-2 [Ancylostoma duodenale]